MEKLEPEVVYSYFKEKGYKVLEDYKNSSTRILCEKEEYRYGVSYSNLRMGKNPSLWGFSNIDNLEYNINVLLRKKKSDSIFIEYKIIQKGNRKRILLTFQCKCGTIFNKILEDTAYNTYICCSNCALLKRGQAQRLGKKIVSALEKGGYKVFDRKQNYRNNDRIEVEDSEGYRGFITYGKFCRGSSISKFDVRVNKKHYVYNVNLYARQHELDVECLSLCVSKHSRQGLKFRCSCGNEFITSIASFQNGKTRCEHCAKSISSYEYAFKEYLEKENIEFISQYSLNQCRDVLPLPFDFYLSKYNKLIEIDGEGHFYPCHFNQISKEKAEKTFEITKRHDSIKNAFCQENNIPLLRIPYIAFQDETYKQLFQNFIKE